MMLLYVVTASASAICAAPRIARSPRVTPTFAAAANDGGECTERTAADHRAGADECALSEEPATADRAVVDFCGRSHGSGHVGLLTVSGRQMHDSRDFVEEPKTEHESLEISL